MQEFVGKTAFPGIASGRIRELEKSHNEVLRKEITDAEAELVLFEQAKEAALERLGLLYDKALQEVGEEDAAIFEVHQMMIEDEDYQDFIRDVIRQQMVVAEYAVAVTGDHFAGMFAAMDDDYMKERAVDVKDISRQIIDMIRKKDAVSQELPPDCIIVADDLTPSETIQLDKDKVIAFVTRKGSVNSHTAILARSMNIPAVVRAPLPAGIDGMPAIIYGQGNGQGRIILEPDGQATAEAGRLILEEARKRGELEELKGKPDVTRSGKSVRLYANIGGLSDLDSVLANDAAGIGLFRSEFLYLERETYPTEEEQFRVYRRVAEAMGGKKVIIRTLDIGADKQISYFDLQQEENPALGYRAIRICLTREEIFRTQLRAIYRASRYGNVAVMIPMIISVWEVVKVKEIMSAVRTELEEEGITPGKVEFGIMIETPAAAMLAEELAAEVDFFSIGTNDLTQYVLAIDRQNAELDTFFDARHPAVMKMIQMVIDGGHRAGIWVGICGELGADTELTGRFVEMGIDELSVAPSMILPVRKKIREAE